MPSSSEASGVNVCVCDLEPVAPLASGAVVGAFRLSIPASAAAGLCKGLPPPELGVGGSGSSSSASSSCCRCDDVGALSRPEADDESETSM